jgi:mono/diheme cytochrome c family protein
MEWPQATVDLAGRGFMGGLAGLRGRTLAAVTLVIVALSSVGAAGELELRTVDQGPAWTLKARNKFYHQDQGSLLIPLRWITVLKQPNGTPFMTDGLARYGYLPDETDQAGLPVGFTEVNRSGQVVMGMTCAACHTRQIEVAGTAYRIDGGPALVDFQSFLSDLDAAVNTVLSDEGAFAEFARAVVGAPPTPLQQAALRQEVGDWYERYHTLMSVALPKSSPWGVGRLDAIQMIFDRLTGLDLGPEPSYLIKANIHPADAPVRYPFLWNAARQDRTQWLGFAANGNDLFALSRNLGQVFGVFGEFHPTKQPLNLFLGMNYWADNSANLPGLRAAEAAMRQIGAPRWPWPVDQAAASEGQRVFEQQGGCSACHGTAKSSTRRIWPTPVKVVGTDSRQFDLLNRTAATGVLEGAIVPPFVFPPYVPKRLQPTEDALNILGLAVVGSLWEKPSAVPHILLKPAEIRRIFQRPPPGYEARALYGIWAAAPYLHNGSVPTLTDLLKPVTERAASFKVGPAYDPDKVGLAEQQPRFGSTMHTTDCSDPASGNSRCGHEYGTTLSEHDIRALIEYLKTL